MGPSKGRPPAVAGGTEQKALSECDIRANQKPRPPTLSPCLATNLSKVGDEGRFAEGEGWSVVDVEKPALLPLRSGRARQSSPTGGGLQAGCVTRGNKNALLPYPFFVILRVRLGLHCQGIGHIVFRAGAPGVPKPRASKKRFRFLVSEERTPDGGVAGHGGRSFCISSHLKRSRITSYQSLVSPDNNSSSSLSRTQSAKGLTGAGETNSTKEPDDARASAATKKTKKVSCAYLLCLPPLSHPI